LGITKKIPCAQKQKTKILSAALRFDPIRVTMTSISIGPVRAPKYCWKLDCYEFHVFSGTTWTVRNYSHSRYERIRLGIGRGRVGRNIHVSAHEVGLGSIPRVPDEISSRWWRQVSLARAGHKYYPRPSLACPRTIFDSPNM